MKTEKGLTLLSLVTYVIAMLIAIGIVSSLIKYFYRNVDEIVVDNNTPEQYTRLVTYLTEDVNSGSITNCKVSENGKGVNLYMPNGVIHQYAYDEANQKLYYVAIDGEGNEQTEIELCDNIESCDFNFAESKLRTKVSINSTIYNNAFYLNFE